jgi:DnaJ-class molecular chaperone
MSTKKNFYQTLGLLNVADDVVIKAAYKALAQKHHPDKHKTNKEFHTQRMADLNEAYAVIGTKAKRKAYDESLKRSSSPKAEKSNTPAPTPSTNEDLIHDLEMSVLDEFVVIALFEKLFATSVKINAGWVNTYTFKSGAEKLTVDFKALKSRIIQKLKQK